MPAGDRKVFVGFDFGKTSEDFIQPVEHSLFPLPGLLGQSAIRLHPLEQAEQNLVVETDKTDFFFAGRITDTEQLLDNFHFGRAQGADLLGIGGVVRRGFADGIALAGDLFNRQVVGQRDSCQRLDDDF